MTRSPSRLRLVALLAACLGSVVSGGAQLGSITERIDAIVEAPIKAGQVAGASVAVVRGRETILDKGYGLADLELNVPTPPRASYEIGSVTKQFTAAAILLLVEQGKLSLDDELTKVLPDYPTQGRRITIRRLLNHTSGIKGYTELPEFGDLMSVDKPRDHLVKLFSAQPFDFEPGEEQIYNNSAFFLLGLIIEKLSGTTYDAFVREQLFAKAGMPDSYYCSERTVRKNHAHGYDTGPTGLVLKASIAHAWPYSAGSLCSTTQDLVAWNRALHGGRILSPASYRELVTPGTLNDGTKLRYGFGISLVDTDGRRTIQHGGGIPGFMSMLEYYPDHDLTIVVLFNTAGPVNPRSISRQIAGVVLGPAPDRARSFTGDLRQFAGEYSGRGRGRPATVRVDVAGTRLTFVNTASATAKPEPLSHLGNDTFGFQDTLVVFERTSGQVTRLRLDGGGGGHNVLARRASASARGAMPGAGTAQTSGERYDVIIRRGTVIDGTGGPRYVADVALSGRWIARIGDLTNAKADVDIDARGLYVAPGFINIHSHASPEGLPTAANMLMQGVTTEIVNADGSGPLDLGAQLSAAEARGLAVNVGANIGFNSAWAAVMGEADRRPGAAEIARMSEHLKAGLDAGAWGVSAGLDYKPAYFAATEDVVKIVDVARASRTHFTSHDRVTPESNFSSHAAMLETLTIGARAGLAPLITHMKVQGHEQGSAERILAEMRRATARGTYAVADVYPYLAGQTGLVAFTIPGWAQDGGREAMLKRFGDPALRARIVREAEIAMKARFGGPEGVFLPETNEELTAAMARLGAPAGETVVRLLEQGNPVIIATFGAEADLVKILRHPTTSVSCDCGAVGEKAFHPRFYGTFPRVLGRYVREQSALTWEDAVRKMTGLPAATIGLVDRGLIGVGMAADVTVFDPTTVVDHATYEAPTRRSDGIRYVWVNGRLALKNGETTGERGGRTLRRSAHMPTRPMTSGESRSLTRRVIGADALTIDVTQAAHAHRATGTFLLERTDAPFRIEVVELGHLQTAPNWASFTARARVGQHGDERMVTVILDGDRLVVDGEGARLDTRLSRP